MVGRGGEGKFYWPLILCLGNGEGRENLTGNSQESITHCQLSMSLYWIWTIEINKKTITTLSISSSSSMDYNDCKDFSGVKTPCSNHCWVIIIHGSSHSKTGGSCRPEEEAMETEALPPQSLAPKYTTCCRGQRRRTLPSWNGRLDRGLYWRQWICGRRQVLGFIHCKHVSL